MEYPQHLTSLGILLSLLPPNDLYGGDDKETQDKFIEERNGAMRLLLYPPDLFAFTSTILGTTGAYYLVVSPAKDLKDLNSNKHTWSPDEILDDEGKSLLNFDGNWATKVGKLGAEWRNFLNKNFNEYKDVLNDSSNSKDVLKTLRINEPDCKFPKGIYDILNFFLEGCDNENINELLCKRSVVIDSLIQQQKEKTNKKIDRQEFERNNEQVIVSRLNQLWNAYCCLISLHAIADEACLGFGIRDHVKADDIKETEKSDLQKYAENLLEERGTLSTIHPDRCRVLPKRHTPNVGMTLRNLSSNLAFTRASVDVKWRKSVSTYLTEEVCKKNEKHPNNVTSLNILLIPCPMKINARDFKVINSKEAPLSNENEAYFEYDPVNECDRWSADPKYESPKDGFQIWLQSVFKKAIKEAGRIDLVIMPETAISSDIKNKHDRDHIEQLESAIETTNENGASISGYIVGASAKRKSSKSKARRLNRNFVVSKMREVEKDGRGQIVKDSDGNPTYKPFEEIKDYDLESDYIQHKHHRWRLTDSQIIQYQLGGILSSGKTWWEGSKISHRKVTFINIGENVTICPLICEDLARQEPISDLIRAVGPSLVISLLMDGPQLADRWSASYAGILADDPRSSMLTLTCAGMVDRWKSTYSRSSPRVVAYWKDNKSYRQEIELEKNKEAIVLYLNATTEKESTADGREEHIGTPYLVYGGMYQV